jgi:hypothetical protein
MHPNFDNACQNVVNHVSNASAFVGHSVACVDATSKRLLGRKRSSMRPQHLLGDSLSDYRLDASCASKSDQPDMSSPRDAKSRGERPTTPTRSLRTQTWQAQGTPAAIAAAGTELAATRAAGTQPAAIWAALVIARALAS